MFIINFYQSEGIIDKDKYDRPINPPMPYDNVKITVFADEWPDQAGGHRNGDYAKFGQPVKELKVPTDMFIDVLGIPYRPGQTTRDILAAYDGSAIIGSEILPTYNDKGKIVNFSVSLAAPVDAADKKEKVNK